MLGAKVGAGHRVYPWGIWSWTWLAVALGRGRGGGMEEGFVVIGLQAYARNVSGLCYFDACLGFLAIGL